jgi:hypothetical protein
LLSESLMIDIVALGVEYPGWIAILGHAIVAEIGEMGVQRRSLRAMTHDSGFDHRSARPVGQISCRREAGAIPPALSAAASAWAMNGLARWLRAVLARPGQMRRSSSRFMARQTASCPVRKFPSELSHSPRLWRRAHLCHEHCCSLTFYPSDRQARCGFYLAFLIGPFLSMLFLHSPLLLHHAHRYPSAIVHTSRHHTLGGGPCISTGSA